ncbi:sensor domain-containing diguanylate cyclase [Clostridium sp. DL1XJH146]
MRNNNRKIEIIKISIIVIVVTFILSMLEWVLLNDYNNNVSSYNNEIQEYYEDQYNTVIYQYRMLSKAYFDETINNNRVLSIIEEANAADEENRSELREELNDILVGTYNNAVENNFRQLHFVLRDSTSFLRMHKVEKYGDNLRDIRDTVRIANEEKIYVEGFEEGRVLNGYRFEYPLFKDNEHIGCVEVSISFISIIKMMDQLFENPSAFIIKKSVVEDKVWEEQIEDNYGQSRISNLYYYDKEAYEYISDKEKYNDFLGSVINDNNVLEKVGKLLEKEETFIINTNNNDQIYTVFFLKIENVVGEQVGYLVFYNENDIFSAFKQSIIIKSIFIAILWVLILWTIFIIYRSKIEMDKITYFDKLTGAYNRNKLYQYIQQEIERNKRYGTSFSIIIYDIDYFKRINDNYGHLVGDLVLKEITHLIKNNIRSNDYLFRFGGDEFIILLPNTKLENAKIVAEKNRAMIDEKEYVTEAVDNITLSTGVAQYIEGEKSEELISRADTVLYKAKSEGRNRVVGV